MSRKTHVPIGTTDLLCGNVMLAPPVMDCALCQARVDAMIDFVQRAAAGEFAGGGQASAAKLCKRFGLIVEGSHDHP